MKDRIRAIRKELSLSQDEFAQKISLTKNYISLVENGNRSLADRTITDLCRIFSVNEKWLRTGEGNMFLPPEDEEAAFVADLLDGDDNPLYDIIKAIMKTYNECGPKEQDILKSFAKAFKENVKKESRD